MGAVEASSSISLDMGSPGPVADLTLPHGKVPRRGRAHVTFVVIHAA